MIKKSFPLRVLCITFIVLALPLLVDSFLFFRRSYEEAIKEAKADLREVANYRSFAFFEIQPTDQEILKEVVFILSQEGYGDTVEEMNTTLEKLAAVSEDIDFFVVQFKGEGRYEVTASNVTSTIGENIISYREFLGALEGDRRGFLRYRYSKERGEYLPYIYMGRPFSFGPEEKEKGMVMVRTEIGRSLYKILTTHGVGKKLQFMLVQSDGVVLAASDKELEGAYFSGISEERREQLAEQEKFGNIQLKDEPLIVLEGEKEPFFQFVYQGELQLGYRAEIPSMKATLIAYLPKGAFFAREMGDFLVIYLLYGFIFIVGGAITYWVTLWLSRPLQQLSNAMEKVKGGNLDVRFTSERFGYEINYLGESFNTTVDKLLENMQRLADERVQKETYEREIKIGRTVQDNLLPKEKETTKEVEIKGHYRSAEEVGGDFYEYTIEKVSEEEKVVSLVIADASGRGISSCLYALAARSFIRSASTLYEDVDKVLTTANNSFLQDTGDTGMFVTVLMGRYNTKSRLLSYYSCGHVPAMVKRKSGEVVVLEHSGMAMGLMEVSALKKSSILLAPGDMVLFYTDGLVDTPNERGVIFSQKRLVKTLEKNNWQTAEEMIEGLITEVTRFAKTPVFEEEVTLLVMKVL